MILPPAQTRIYRVHRATETAFLWQEERGFFFSFHHIHIYTEKNNHPKPSFSLPFLPPSRYTMHTRNPDPRTMDLASGVYTTYIQIHPHIYIYTCRRASHSRSLMSSLTLVLSCLPRHRQRHLNQLLNLDKEGKRKLRKMQKALVLYHAKCRDLATILSAPLEVLEESTAAALSAIASEEAHSI